MTIIKHKEILSLGYNLSPSQLSVLDIPNKNTVIVENLLDRKLKLSDKGSESGSVNYVSQSSYYFIRPILEILAWALCSCSNTGRPNNY